MNKRLSTDIQKTLFQPLDIGGIPIANRYAMAPTNCLFSDWTGMVSDDDVAYLIARAKGGSSLIIAGSVLVTELGKQVAPHPWIHMTGMEHVPQLALLAESIHLSGSRVFLQMLVSPGSRARPVSGERPVAPSAGIKYLYVKDKAHPRAESILARGIQGPWLKSQFLSDYPEPREITLGEIRGLVDEVARNARFAVLAGYDGIEIHTCHHYLVDEFRDPRFNHRGDRYGGNRMNRHRFLLELVEATLGAAKKEKPGFTVGVRVGSECGGEGGYGFEDTLWLAPQLERMGIDYWHTIFGFPPTSDTSMDSPADGGYLPWSRRLKEKLTVPVLTPGVHGPELAAKAISNGWTDMVTLARPLMADPELPNKVKAGQIDKIRKCNKDAFCWVGVDLRLPLRCSVNPELGFEKHNPKYCLRRGFSGKNMLPRVLG